MISERDADLAPGKGCEAKVQFLPTVVGESSASLWVDAQLAGSATVDLAGAGLAPGALVLSPAAESSSEFGAVTVESTQTHTFTLANPGVDPSGVFEIWANSPEFEIVDAAASPCVANQTSLLPGEWCSIALAFTPSARGRVDATLVVSSAGAGAAGINVSGEGLVAGELRASAERIDFQNVVRGELAFAELALENAGDLPLPIGAVEITGEHAGDFSLAASTCGESLEGGATCAMQLQFTPGEAGARSAVLSLQVADATRRFALSGVGLQPGSLLLTAVEGLADFSSVLVGETRVHTFTLQNPGEQPSGALIDITAGADFVPLPPSLPTDCQVGSTTLVNGESCTISVSFTPTERGARRASLSVASPLAGTVALQLVGRGVVPPDAVALTDVVDFSDVVRGQSAAATVVITNQGDEPAPPPTITLSGERTGSFGFQSGCSAPLEPEARCEIVVTFQPEEAVNYSVTLQLDAGAGGTTSVALRGRGLDPGSLIVAAAANDSAAFGEVAVGVERIQTFTVSNPGDVASGPLAISVRNNDSSAAFARVAPAGGDCVDASTLVDGESCTVRVRFLPRTNLSFGATLSVVSPGAGSANLSLSGRGVRSAILTQSESRDFGDRAIGDASRPLDFTRNWTISNTGDVTSATPVLTASNPGEFVVTGNGCNVALAPAASCTLSIEFRPAAAGRREGQITIAAAASQVVLSMVGDGFQRVGPGGACNVATDCAGGTNATTCGNGANGARVCCASACQGTCEFCNAQGQCVALQGGEACSAADTRRGCFGRNRCLLPAGQACNGDNANCGSGNCEAAAGGGANVCCEANCALGQECSPNFLTCQASLGELGDSCGGASDCRGGLACGQSLDGVGGRCCESACTGSCQGCDAAGDCVSRARDTACGNIGQVCLSATSCDYPRCVMGSVLGRCRLG